MANITVGVPKFIGLNADVALVAEYVFDPTTVTDYTTELVRHTLIKADLSSYSVGTAIQYTYDTGFGVNEDGYQVTAALYVP
jgi:hypothetical protein